MSPPPQKDVPTESHCQERRVGGEGAGNTAGRTAACAEMQPAGKVSLEGTDSATVSGQDEKGRAGAGPGCNPGPPAGSSNVDRDPLKRK